MASRLYGTTRQLFVRVSAVLDLFGLRDVLSPTALALLAIYVTGLILLDVRQTPWRMQEWLPARCHDALNRLLRVMSVSTRAIMRCLALWAKRKGVLGYLTLDGVIVEKPYSRLSRWMGWNYSYKDQRQVFGFHIVVLSWCTDCWRIPVAFRIWRPKASCSAKDYHTKLQLAQQMIIDILPVGLPIEYITFDNGFTAGWFTKFVGRCGLRWVGVLNPKTVVHYRDRRYQVHELAERLDLRWRERLQLRARAVTVYAPKYGTLRLVVTRDRHGNYECMVSNDLEAGLTTLVLRKRSRWSIETVFRDSKQFTGLAACQARVDQALVRHVAFALLTFVVLQVLRLHPEETLGEVKERLQLDALRAGEQPPAPLKAKAALL